MREIDIGGNPIYSGKALILALIETLDFADKYLVLEGNWA
jgi:hypothetical protein